MSEKTFLLSEAMGYIADEYLEEAHPEISENTPTTRRRPHIGYRIALAACLCLVAVGALHFALSSKEVFTNAMKGDAVAPEADCPIADAITPDGNSGASVGCTDTHPEESTAQETEEETTTDDTLSAETQAAAQSETS